MRKKALSPAHRRAAALEAVAAGMCSRRAAGRILRRARSTLSYQGRAPTTAEEQLRKRLHELSVDHPRYGYRRLAALLRREGWRVGKRHIQRLRRQEGLRVPPTKRKVIPARRFHGRADAGHPSRTCVDVGLHRGRHRAGRSTEDVDDPG